MINNQMMEILSLKRLTQNILKEISDETMNEENNRN